ncbi:hypothetical protein [Limnoraphis robusta]|uniref:hypothetical protein n=1 Tax=Limnoraphis robusta TaxID=1118279 RepID=UPI002B20176B|nr:hypothetical protein [Limnoraphis robusta]MEA5498032.1 hypothetical protein [Limnoraphis robusta BA-68 BA1]
MGNNLQFFLGALHNMIPVEQEIRIESAELTGLNEAMESLGLKSSAFYERMKFLGITPTKEGRKAFLSPQQLKQLQQLGQHIEETGSMERFGTNGQLALRNSETSLATADEELGQYEEEIGNTQSDFDTQYNGIVADAREHRTGVEMAKYAIAAQLDLEDLTPEQIQQIEAVRAATLPKSVSASQTAADILRQYRKGKI